MRTFKDSRAYIEPVALLVIIAAPWPALLIPPPTSLHTASAIQDNSELRLNYAGAALFIGYIIAALVLTGLITRTLYDTYRAVINDHDRKTTLKIFAGLTLTSFSVLSYHMLSFLIVSYTSWRMKNQPDLQGDGVYPLVQSIWQWTTTSTLFLDFAKDLCNVEKSHVWPWSETALVSTLLSFFYMSAAGKFYIGSSQ